jgi:hypothetical protein
LYSPPSIIRIMVLKRMALAGHVARMGEKRNACKILVGKPEGKRPLGRPRRSWVGTIRMDLGEIELDGCGSGEGPVVGSCEGGDEPSGSIKCWEILEWCTIGGSSRRAQLHE